MEFGNSLKEEREKQGFTLDDVEEETKIRKLYINALENENFSVLPPRVYAVGIVRRYAKFLKIDEENAVGQFQSLAYLNREEENQENTQEENKSQHIAPVVERKQGPERRIDIKKVLAAIAFVVIVVWLGNVMVSYMTNRGAQQARQNKTSVTEPRMQQNAAKVKKSPVIARATVTITANQRCWIEIKADGVEQFSGTLLQGQKKTFTGKNLIYMKAGNAGGISVTLNGKDIKSIGKSVVEYEFLKDGTARKL